MNFSALLLILMLFAFSALLQDYSIATIESYLYIG